MGSVVLGLCPSIVGLTPRSGQHLQECMLRPIIVDISRQDRMTEVKGQ